MNNSLSEYSVLVGLDWANKKHDVCLQLSGPSSRSFSMIGSSPEAVDEWVKDLHQRYGGQIAIALELDKGPIVYALQKYDYVTLFPVHPLMLKILLPS